MPKLKKIDESKYIYAVSRIRAIEKRLLDKVKLDRMVEAKSADESLKVLLEAGYGSGDGDIKSVFEYENILKEEHKKVYSLLNELAPKQETINMFLLSNDYHNVKVILKAEFSEQDETSLLIEPGSIPVSELKLMIKDRNMSKMPSIMRKAVEEAIDTYSRTNDPQVIDLILDKANYVHMKSISDSLDNKFINELVVILIDLRNINIFLRVKNLKKSWDFLQKVLIPGGHIDIKVFIENFDAPLESLVEELRFTQYGPLLEDGIESLRSTGSLTKFEKLSDNFITSYVKKAKYIAFGIEPLIGYLMAKETEIKNARIIMVGKINNISNDVIRERLRESYV
ncbi:V-type ATP synthase subunit C [Acetivibrio thermocellus]|uniref:V-type ATP synthase subunit C n=1 Tax=Acetivibrio thermocellus TaxID=1515 RepID=UPI0010A695BB|nr:V-type ATP synthase subunit C [Acetivibrio thermocellus]THJ77490.1 V-type ATP synthase subunit C [Acetivibrio thermocellus]